MAQKQPLNYVDGRTTMPTGNTSPILPPYCSVAVWKDQATKHMH